MTLFLGPFLRLAAMVTKPESRAFFPWPGRLGENWVDCPGHHATTLLPKRPTAALLCCWAETGLHGGRLWLWLWLCRDETLVHGAPM